MNTMLRFKGKPSSVPSTLLTLLLLAAIALLVVYAWRNDVFQDIRWPW